MPKKDCVFERHMSRCLNRVWKKCTFLDAAGAPCRFAKAAVMATVTVSVTDIVVLSVIDIAVVPLPGCMLVVSVAVPLAVAMLKPLSCPRCEVLRVPWIYPAW